MKGRRPNTDAKRLEEVEEMLLAGLTGPQVEKMALSRWGVQERQARRYVAAILDHWKAEGMTPVDAMMRHTYRKANAEGKFAPAIAALSQIAKSDGAGHSNAVKAYKKAGPVPDDPTKVIAWSQRILAITLKEVTSDARLDDAERREEIRKTARCMAALTPQDELFDAARKIRRDAEDLDEPSGGPKVENVTSRNPRTLRADPTRKLERRPPVPDPTD